MTTIWLRSLAVAACLGGLLHADHPVAQYASFNDWLGAEAKGVRVGADGRLRLAPNARRVAQLPEGVVWSVISDGAGGAILSAGNEGKLFRFSGGQVKPFAQVKGGMIFAMARLGQDVLVAPSGEGKVLRVTPAGDVKPFAEVDTRLVWAMHVVGNEVMLAGGGEKGAVLVLAREGSSRKLAELPDETSFTALIPDGQGGYVLGTHGRGQVVRYLGAARGDRIENIMATGFEEVRALVQHEGSIYIAVNNGLSTRIASGNLEKRETYVSEPSATSRCAVIRLDRQGIPETCWQSSQVQVFSMTSWQGQLLIGTGNRSRIFALPLGAKDRASDPFCAMQDLGVAQVSTFLPMGSDLLAVGSNPAELHVMSEALATEGILDSKVLKGAPIAQWGRAYLDADTPSGTNVEVQFRSGNTELPDGTWSPWTPLLRSGERPNLQTTRFCQFRLRLTSSRGGATPTVETFRVHWANKNLAPVWESVDILPPGVVLTRQSPPDDIGIERIPMETQKLIPALGYAGSEKRSFRRGAQAFMFKITDPNADQLSFQLRLLPEQGAPMELEKAWKERFFTFDTLPVPDGKYRLEITATDAPSQPFNQAMTSLWKTAPFVVDHTPPGISEASATFEGENIRVRFTAKDATSVIREALVSADGDAWLQLAPDELVFDAQEEHFDVLVPKDRLRGDRVLIKVADVCNNEQALAVHVDAVLKKKATK